MAPALNGQGQPMFLIKILDTLEWTLKFLCTVVMAGIVAMLFYAVVMRYAFHMPPAWTMELSRYLFLWMVMLCAVVVTREESHIRMSFLVNLIPPKPRFVWMTILRILMIGFCYVMIHYGMAILPVVSQAKSPTLEVSMGYMYASVPVGGALMAFYLVELIVRSVVNKSWSIPDEVA